MGIDYQKAIAVDKLHVKGCYFISGGNDDHIQMVTPTMMGVFINGVSTFGVTSSGCAANMITSLAGGQPLILKGIDNDDATAVGVALDNVTAMTTAGGKIASFRNAAVEKGFIDKDGQAELSALNAVPTVSANGRFIIYLDEAAHTLKIAVKYSDGTAKTGTIALV